MAYFPNGSSGEALDIQCAECRVSDDAPCPVLLVQTEYNYEQCDNPKLEEAINMLVNSAGKCQMKIIIDDHLT